MKIKGTLSILLMLSLFFPSAAGADEFVDKLKVTFTKDCPSLSQLDKAIKSGPVGSSIRGKLVKDFYAKVKTSPCILWGDSVITSPYYPSYSTPDIWTDFDNSLGYSLKSWNGIEPYKAGKFFTCSQLRCDFASTLGRTNYLNIFKLSKNQCLKAYRKPC
jgi:hypothetical protein